MHKAGRFLLASLIVAMLLAGAVLVKEGTASDPGRGSEEFQQLVGGLGFGPALDLSRCPMAFDPRLGSTCEEDSGSIPCGNPFCPQHGTSVFDFPPLGDATSPLE
jgi:hypothetical protein